MTDKKKNGWIKFVPSSTLTKERVSIAYDTHDERGVRYAYGYFQFYNGTCGCFWKDGNEQPKVVKAEDIKYWMPVPSLDVQEEPVEQNLSNVERIGKDWKEEPVSEDTMTIRKEWFEHCKESWYNEGYIDGKYNRDRQFKEPVSEGLEEACEQLAENARKHKAEISSPFFSQADYIQGVMDGAKWQITKLMANATPVTVYIDAGGYPYIPQLELYDYDKDIPLANEGDKYKVILIKEE